MRPIKLKSMNVTLMGRKHDPATLEKQRDDAREAKTNADLEGVLDRTDHAVWGEYAEELVQGRDGASDGKNGAERLSGGA